MTTYPEFIAWHLPLEGFTDANQIFSAKTAKKIRSGLRILDEQEYQFHIEDFDERYIDRFDALYRSNLEAKKSPRIKNIRQMLANAPEQRQYKILVLEKDGVMLGGLTFFISYGHTLMTVLKVFPYALPDTKLPISPTFLAEYKLFAHCFDLGLDKIVHGRDKNIYGKNSAIGLAMFKTQLGCKPRAAVSAMIFPLESIERTEEDMLVFLASEAKEFIDHAILYTRESPEVAREKYATLFASEHFTVEIRP